LKAAREKCQLTCIGKLIRIISLLISNPKNMKAWNVIFEAPRVNNCKARLLCAVKLFFKISVEIKDLPG
jgi:hypothetical protein